MNNESFQEMIEKLLRHAMQGESTKFVQLRFWSEYRYFKDILRSYRVVLNGLTAGAKRLYKSYCKDVELGTDTPSKAAAYKQMLNVLSFYEHEIETISDMLREYKLYLLDGHFINSFLGEYRDDQNLVNYLDKERP